MSLADIPDVPDGVSVACAKCGSDTGDEDVVTISIMKERLSIDIKPVALAFCLICNACAFDLAGRGLFTTESDLNLDHFKR